MVSRHAALCLLTFVLSVLPAGAQIFRSDDPLKRDRDDLDSPKPGRQRINDYWDFVENTFLGKGDHSRRRAVNINTLGEVPDSSWYTNRISLRPMRREELLRGPGADSRPAPGKWSLISGKSQGISPGFTVRDSRGETYFLKFDPSTNPEMATAAEVISTRILHALGYNVPENCLVEFDPSDLQLDPAAVIENELGERVPLSLEDANALLARVAVRNKGRVRAVASRRIAGEGIGPFKFYGTRSDDANDVFDHEHRRELRAYYVFCSWLNHDDSRSINTIDFYVTENGRSFTRHYLIDFGSTLGSGSVFAQKRRPGNEYLWEARPTFASILSLGLWLRPWVSYKYPEFPSVGRLEYQNFDPGRWKPEYPNAAFRNLTDEDAFWAARQLMRFSDDDLKAIVATAELSDTAAAEYLTRCLIERRDKIGRYWLGRVLPLDDFRTDGHRLLFEDLNVRYGFEPRMQTCSVRFERFDNLSGSRSEIGRLPDVRESPVELPSEMQQSPRGTHFVVNFQRGDHWADVFLRNDGGELQVVGIERK